MKCKTRTWLTSCQHSCNSFESSFQRAIGILPPIRKEPPGHVGSKQTEQKAYFCQLQVCRKVCTSMWCQSSKSSNHIWTCTIYQVICRGKMWPWVESKTSKKITHKNIAWAGCCPEKAFKLKSRTMCRPLLCHSTFYSSLGYVQLGKDALLSAPLSACLRLLSLKFSSTLLPWVHRLSLFFSWLLYRIVIKNIPVSRTDCKCLHKLHIQYGQLGIQILWLRIWILLILKNAVCSAHKTGGKRPRSRGGINVENYFSCW